MYILIVTPQPLPGPQHVELGNDHYFLRSHRSGMRSLQIDIAFLHPDCTDEQEELAHRMTWSCQGRVLKATDEILLAVLRSINHPGAAK